MIVTGTYMSGFTDLGSVITLRSRSFHGLLAAAVAGMFMVSSPANAEPPKANPNESTGSYVGIAPEVAAMMRLQAAPSAAAKPLEQVIAGLPDSGYMNLLVDGGGLVLRWKGEVPESVTEAVTDARTKVPVRVEQVKYSFAELDRAAERIGKVLDVSPKGGTHTVTILGDGSGIRVSRVADMAATAIPTVDVPVETVIAPRPELYSRDDDSAPWWGGAHIMNANGRGNCSSAFPVTDGTGGQWLLTAAHCGTPIDVFRDPTGERIGNATREVFQHDILLISALVLDTGQGRVLTGGLNDTVNLPIAGWDHARPGEVYCQSGVTTARTIGGQLCGLRMLEDLQRRICDVDSDGDWVCISDLAAAQEWNGGTSARPGDSGGPVYGIASNQTVFARGLVTGTPDGGRTLYFQDYATVWNDMGVVPITG